MRARRLAALTRLAASAAFCVLAGSLLTTASAQQGTAVPRKPARRSQPPHAVQAAPDRTGSIARPADSFGPPAPLSPADDGSLAFYYLPDAPRSRMRACGETWRAKRLAGETGDEDWRDFATKCLVAAEAPPSP